MFNKLRDAIEMFEMNLDDFNYNETLANFIEREHHSKYNWDYEFGTVCIIFGYRK